MCWQTNSKCQEQWGKLPAAWYPIRAHSRFRPCEHNRVFDHRERLIRLDFDSEGGLETWNGVTVVVTDKDSVFHPTLRVTGPGAGRATCTWWLPVVEQITLAPPPATRLRQENCKGRH